MSVIIEPTTLNLANATKYASQLYLQKSIHDYFKRMNIKLVKKSNIYWDKSILKGIHDTTKLEPMIEYEFDEEGCTDINCFEYVKFRHCTDYSKSLTVNDGPNTYQACQPACTKFKVKMGTIWDDKSKSCKMINTALKKFCIIPSSRTDTPGYLNKQPPFTWDDLSSNCTNNAGYCSWFSQKFTSDGSCETPGWIKFSQAILGQTYTSQMSHDMFFPSNIYRKGWEDVEFDPNAGINPDKKNLAYTKELVSIDRKKQTVHAEVEIDFNSELLKKLAEFILENLGAYAVGFVGTKIITFVITKINSIVLEEVLPAGLYAFCSSIALAVESCALYDCIITGVEVLTFVLEELLSILDPIGISLIVSSLIGLIIDYTSKAGKTVLTDFRNFISKDALKKIVTKYNDQYSVILENRKKFNGLAKMTPLLVWYANTHTREPNDDRIVFIITKSAQYLRLLKYNSLGQKITYAGEHTNKIKIKPEIHEESLDLEKYLLKNPTVLQKTTLIIVFTCICLTTILYEKTYNLMYLFILFVFVVFFTCFVLVWWMYSTPIEDNLLKILYKSFEPSEDLEGRS